MAQLLLAVGLIQQSSVYANPSVYEQGHSVQAFYTGVDNPDGLLARPDGSVLVVNEASPGGGVLVATQGDTYDPGDAYAPLGSPFISPDGITADSTGAVYVADSEADAVIRIASPGAVPYVFSTSAMVEPFGLAIAPAGYTGPNVNPGDVLVADGGFLGPQRGLYALDPAGNVSKIATTGAIDLAISDSGSVLVTQGFGIREVSAAGVVTNFISGLPFDTEAIEVHPVTGEIFVGHLNAAGGHISHDIYKIDAISKQVSLFATNFGDLTTTGIEFSVDGGTMFVSDPFNNTIWAIDGFVPEPATFLLFGLGSLALLRTHRAK